MTSFNGKVSGLSIAGITVSVLFRPEAKGGEFRPLKIQEFGFLGTQTKGQFKLSLQRTPTSNVLSVPFHINSDKVIYQCEAIATAKGPTYEREINVLYTKNRGSKYGCAYSNASTNSLQVASFGKDGDITVSKISIATQKNRWFLFVQNKVFKIYHNGDELIIPKLADSAALAEYLIKSAKGVKIPRLPKKQSSTQATKLARNEGKVIWFDPSIGFGSVMTRDNKEARVRFMDVVPNKFSDTDPRAPIVLFENQIVRIGKVYPKPANEKTKFKYIAKFVTPLRMAAA